jgi:hypothetical protein
MPNWYEEYIKLYARYPLRVNIEVVEYANQRYETVGDWFINPSGTLIIRIAKILDKSGAENVWMEHLIALHEYVEALLCLHRGITEEMVTYFDLSNINSKEPGNLPEAPYYNEHQFATFVEYKMAEQLKINWEEYDASVENVK